MSELSATRFEPIALSSESTVVAEFLPDIATCTAYQSEAELERELIRLLQDQAYEYLAITTEAQLIANLRNRLEALNGITFSDGEWERFFTTCVAGVNDGIIEKTVRIQEDYVQLLKRDDGSFKNIALVDTQNIHNNVLQVINQYEIGVSLKTMIYSKFNQISTEAIRNLDIGKIANSISSDIWKNRWPCECPRRFS